MNNAETFSMLPLIKPGHCVIHVNDELDMQEMFTNIESFKTLLLEKENYLDNEFEWYDKKLPLLVKYLHWKGPDKITPVEEICQIAALDAHMSEREYTGPGQWWHDYTDSGFDVVTTVQYCAIKYGQKKKRTESKKLMKGLVLMSTRPGSKYDTRKWDANDPLDWVKKKQEFDNRCVCCGAEEGRFGGKNNGLVRLEKGHIDPRKGYSHSNIIPQCGSCNNHKGNEVYGPSQEDPKRYIVIETLSPEK